MIDYIGHGDPTTRRQLEEIRAAEEEHPEDLRMLIDAVGQEKRGVLRENVKG